MRAICPNNPEHKRFVAVAYVSEDWLVDEQGNFLEVAPGSETYTLFEPNPDNIWYCYECSGNIKAMVDKNG